MEASIHSSLDKYIPLFPFFDHFITEIIVITAGSDSPQLGQSHSLTCNVTGTTSSDVITYRWRKDGALHENETQSTLPFPFFKLSDAGMYACEVTVDSTVYSSENSRFLTIQSMSLICLLVLILKSHTLFIVSAPSDVTVISDPVSPVRPVGPGVTLICAVELSSGPEMDVSVTVNFQLSRADPAGSLLPVTTQSVNGSSHTSITTTISSFGREHSGNYTCTATISSTLNSSYLISSKESYGIAWVTVGKRDMYIFYWLTNYSKMLDAGVYLALRNRFIDSNSNILITNIGTTSDSPSGALQCVTDRNPCCRNVDPRLGEWYFPSGTLVQQGTSITKFYRNRGDDGTVSLNHPFAVLSPTGRFCCVVPDALNTNQTVCINIGESLTSTYIIYKHAYNL